MEGQAALQIADAESDKLAKEGQAAIIKAEADAQAAERVSTAQAHLLEKQGEAAIASCTASNPHTPSSSPAHDAQWLAAEPFA